jgi:hypothetical protein
VHEAVAVGIGTGCLLFAAAVSAAGPLARKRMEASMLVEGTLGITPGGTVLAYSLDQAEELPPAVVQMIAKAVPRRTFKPVLVDGKPVGGESEGAPARGRQPGGRRQLPGGDTKRLLR